MRGGNSVLSSYGTTIFTVMSHLAQQHQAVNLGQGFPEGLEPPDVIAAAISALESGPHQYPPMMGLPVLRDAIAAHAQRFYGLAVDPETEVMVTSGATEALADCLFGLIEPGDEVIVFEPTYDSYIPIIRRAGGIAVTIPLTPPAWDMPLEALEAAFSDKTKLVMLNSPLNPCAKVFDIKELDALSALVKRFDCYVVCDEVYEHLVFDGGTHHPLITRPGMRERCVKIGSAGKIFSITNWKVGWIIAAPELLTPIAKAHQFLTFTTPTPLQMAVAQGLAKPDRYYRDLVADLSKRRDQLRDGLEGLGFRALPCPGTYFLTVDCTAVLQEGEDDVAFCRRITTEAGVAAVPNSAFYRTDGPQQATEAIPRYLVRFCFAKTETAIREALHRLTTYL